MDIKEEKKMHRLKKHRGEAGVTRRLSHGWLCLLVALLLVADYGVAQAQNRDKQMRQLVDSVLKARYYASPYDSDYVSRPEGTKLTLKLRLNQSGNSIHARGELNDTDIKAHLHTSYNTTLAVVAIYRGLGVGVAINPSKLKGINKDYEFNMHYYSNRFSFDLSYLRSNTLAGDIDQGGLLHLEKEDAEMKVLNLAAYYIFNHRKFSYSAAFTQSYIQRRSAGSWLAGLSYQGGSIKTTQQFIDKDERFPDMRIYAGHVGIGGGYGYNLVVGRKWLFHFSAVPTFVVYNRNNLTINGERRKAQHMRFNMIFNERAAIVYNFSTRYFAGITMVMNNSVFDDTAIIINQNKWRLRAFFGMRL